MKDELVGFEVAKLAYQKGYSCDDRYNPCFITFIDNGDKYEEVYYNEQEDDGWLNIDNIKFKSVCDEHNLKFSYEYERPTQSLLQRWLREVHNIHVWCIPNNTPTECDGYLCFANGHYAKNDIYEQALEAGLFEALNLIP